MSHTHYPKILNIIYEEVQPLLTQGKVPDYIPELASVSPSHFGMAVVMLTGEIYTIGEVTKCFSIQSISKLFALTLAFQLYGNELWQRVGREPSGTRFNSLVQLESEQGIPRNPFINAGALVITDLLCSRFVQAEIALIQFIQLLTQDKSISYDRKVAHSELLHSHRNRAMANFMKSFNNISNPVEDVIEAYCRQCAIEMNCIQLAKALSFLANHGINPWSGDTILDMSSSKRLSALMLTCGTYDAAGDFAYRVGLPAKSGVGGGIVAHIPGLLSLCVWSPALEESGNSLAGTYALERFTTLTRQSIF